VADDDNNQNKHVVFHESNMFTKEGG